MIRRAATIFINPHKKDVAKYPSLGSRIRGNATAPTSPPI
jgi:hypothetical protein